MNKRVKQKALKILSSVIVFFIFIYITIFICVVPAAFPKVAINSEHPISYSLKTALRYTNQKLIYLLKGNFDANIDDKKLSEIIIPYINKSLTLLICGMFLALILGVLKGIIDSRRKKKEATFKVLLSLVPLSLPDLLIVSLLQCLAIWLSQHGIKLVKVAGSGGIDYIILPIIALAIPSACYIARMTAIAIDECYESEYIKTAIGKGCSSSRILWNHVMRNTAGIIIESFSNITAIVICNMLIVEYMFSYPGLTLLLTKTLGNNNINSLIFVVIIIGILYLAINSMIYIMKVTINRSTKGDNI